MSYLSYDELSDKLESIKIIFPTSLDILNENLGTPMTTKQVADYLGVDTKTVRKYYRELGGIRLGRHYRFFEQEICNAVQTKRQMDSPGEKAGITKGKNISDKKGGSGLGIRDEQKARKRMDREDRHSLFD